MTGVEIALTAAAVVAGVLLLLCAIALFMIFPALRRHPDRKLFRGKCIAHRGLHGVNAGADGGPVPENSLKAFELAAAGGFPIETDVHLTADGKAVVFHDDDLERMCGVRGRPEDHTLEELRSMRLGGTDETVPSLEEVLAAVGGRVPLLIEFKCLDLKTCDALCESASKLLDAYGGPYAIQSFFPFVPRWYKKNRPAVMRGQLSSGFYRESFIRKLAGAMMYDFLARPDFVAYDCANCGNVFFRLCGKLGAMKLGWTFRDSGTFKSRKKYFDGYIFEGKETVQ